MNTICKSNVREPAFFSFSSLADYIILYTITFHGKINNNVKLQWATIIYLHHISCKAHSLPFAVCYLGYCLSDCHYKNFKEYISLNVKMIHQNRLKVNVNAFYSENPQFSVDLYLFTGQTCHIQYGCDVDVRSKSF